MSAAAPNIAALMGGGGMGMGGGPPNGQHTIQVQPPGGGADPVAALRGLAAGSSSGRQSVTVDKCIADLHTLAGQTDDPQDKQAILKALQLVQGIQVQEQKEKESALGTTPAHRYMAKQSGA